jgi:hypothetical protein
MRHDALALSLVPSAESRTRRSNVDTVGGSAAGATGAVVRRTVALHDSTRQQHNTTHRNRHTAQ